MTRKLGATSVRSPTLWRILPHLLAALAVTSAYQLASAQIVLPPDAEDSCLIETDALRSWFASADVTDNGLVKAPHNLTRFTANQIGTHVPGCEFFQRSAHMFLWLTSPPPPTYGGGSRVFNSSIFYHVSHEHEGKRVLKPMSSEDIRFDLNLPQLGPNNLPLVFDANGKMYPVVRLQTGPNGRPLIRDKKGVAIEIERMQISKAGKPVFLDRKGQVIDYQTTPSGAPRLLDKSGRVIDFRPDRVVVNGVTFFLDGQGSIIETEAGQVGQAVLMAQGKRPVYYQIQVNDVFAYFLTGTKNGRFEREPKTFPSTGEELERVKAFAKTHANHEFLEPNVLAVTLKSAWVEAKDFSDDQRRKYLIVTASIPKYVERGDKKWVRNGSEKVDLALVGMHVVFGFLNHPEMIWATFEHVSNTPHAPYAYFGPGPTPRTAPQPTGGSWLFSANPLATDVNQSHMRLDEHGNIVVRRMDDLSQTIGPSNLLRINPWGVPKGDDEDSARRMNTAVISFNRSLQAGLHPNDVRRNYLLMGATWTVGGAAPPDSQDGTSMSANTTMESFQQDVEHGCFGCHRGGQTMLGLPDGKGLSRIWGKLEPLPPP